MTLRQHVSLALPVSVILSFFTPDARATSTALDCMPFTATSWVCDLRVQVPKWPTSIPDGLIKIAAGFELYDSLGSQASTLLPGELRTLGQAFGTEFGSQYQVPSGFEPTSFHGLVYPLRDALTYSGDPYIGTQDLDPQNGTVHAPKPGEDFWAITGIVGRANYSPAGVPPRGNPFAGGADGYINVYSIKITANDLTPRLVQITLTSNPADNQLVLADGSIVPFEIPTTTFMMMIPAPSSLPPVLLGFLAATRRRR